MTNSFESIGRSSEVNKILQSPEVPQPSIFRELIEQAKSFADYSGGPDFREGLNDVASICFTHMEVHSSDQTEIEFTAQRTRIENEPEYIDYEIKVKFIDGMDKDKLPQCLIKICKSKYDELTYEPDINRLIFLQYMFNDRVGGEDFNFHSEISYLLGEDEYVIDENGVPRLIDDDEVFEDFVDSPELEVPHNTDAAKPKQITLDEMKTFFEMTTFLEKSNSINDVNDSHSLLMAKRFLSMLVNRKFE